MNTFKNTLCWTLNTNLVSKCIDKACFTTLSNKKKHKSLTNINLIQIPIALFNLKEIGLQNDTVAIPVLKSSLETDSLSTEPELL